MALGQRRSGPEEGGVKQGRVAGHIHPVQKQERETWWEPLQPNLDSDLSVLICSHDQRFFVKTQRRQEVQVLLANLPRYVQHLQQHPHSLLARLLGKLLGGGSQTARCLGRVDPGAGPKGTVLGLENLCLCFRLGWDFTQVIEKGVWGWDLEGKALVRGGS